MAFDPLTARPVDQFDPLTATPDSTLGSAVRRGTGNLISSVGSSLRDIADNRLTQGIEDYGRGVAERNPAEVTDAAGILENPLTFAKQAIAEQVPQFGVTLAGAGAGALAGSVLGPAGAAVGGIIGGLVPTFAQEYGGIRQEQREQGIDDRGRALEGAVPAAALELLGPEAIAIKNIAKGVGKTALKAGEGIAADGSRLAHMGKEALKSIPVEAGTEVGQTALERYGAFQPLTGDDATNDYILSGAAGGIAGGAFGAGAAAFTPRDPVDPSKPAGPVVRAALAAPTLVPGQPDPQAAADQQRAQEQADIAAQTRDAEREAEVERRQRYMDASNMEVGEIRPDIATLSSPLGDERMGIGGIDVGESEDITLESPEEPRRGIEGIEVGEPEEITLETKDAAPEDPGPAKKNATSVGKAELSELSPTERATYEQMLANRTANQPAKSARRDEPEIRADNGEPFKTYPGANAARKKFENADDYEVKRLDKGQFVLARKADGTKQEPAAEVAPASDGRSGADAPRGDAGAPVDAGRAGLGDVRGDAEGTRSGDGEAVPVGAAQSESAPALTEANDEPTQDALGTGSNGQSGADGETGRSVGPGGSTALVPGQEPGGQPASSSAQPKAAPQAGQSASEPLTDGRPAEGGVVARPAAPSATGVAAADGAGTGTGGVPVGEGTVPGGREPAAVAEPAATIRRDDGTPFPTALAANVARAGRPDKADYNVVKVADGQYELQRVKETPVSLTNEPDEVKEAAKPDADAADVQTPETAPVAQGQETSPEASAVAAPEPNTPTTPAVPEAAAATTRAGEADTTPAADAAAASLDAQIAKVEASIKTMREVGRRAETDQIMVAAKEKLRILREVRQAETTLPATGSTSPAVETQPGSIRDSETPNETVHKTKLAAGAARAKAGQKDTHDIVPVEGGFAVRAKAATSAREFKVGQQVTYRPLRGGPEAQPIAATVTDVRNFYGKPDEIWLSSGHTVDSTSERLAHATQPEAQVTPAATDKNEPKSAPPKDDRTPRQIEREAFLFAVSTTELQEAATGDRAAFDAKAAEALRASGYEKFATDDAFLASAYAEAKKRQRAAERERGRDPVVYQAKLAEVTAAANLPDGEHENFKLGFDHALAGRTKSTITGDSKLAGYEAARTWLKTPEGRAFFDGKRVAKLENTGADLKRWFDKMQADAKAAQGEWRNVWTALDRATTRANVFRPDLASATPGTRRVANRVRDSLFTFKEFLDNKGTVHKWNSDTFDEALERHFRRSEDPEKKIQDLRDAAADYLTLMQTVSSGLSGATNVADIAAKIDATFYADNQLRDEVRPVIGGYVGRKLLGSLRPGSLEEKYSELSNLQFNENIEDGPSDRKKPLQRPRLDHVSRAGRKDYRQGRDVTPKEFKDTFGFADVGFGKWVGGRQDQDHLNYAYDSFMDLADVLGIQPSAISLGGTLHFTIGALGHGKAAAHYQAHQQHPDGGTVPVINVTNTKGDGSVAHEWFHALDYALRGAGRGSAQRGAVEALVGQLQSRLQKSSIDDGIAKFVRGGWFYKGAGIGRNDRLGQARYALEHGSYGRAQTTAYKTNADTLGEDYWGNREELFARAAEAWVYDQLGETANTYLVSDWVADSKVNDKEYRGTPYPQADERAYFNTLFKALFESIDFGAKGPTFKDDDRVRAAVKQEADDFSAYREAMLAKLPELFREQRQPKAGPAPDEDTDRLIADQKRREEQRAAIEAAEQEQRPAAITSDKALSEDELSALFDEAASELREANSEKPDVPDPGESKGRVVPKRTEDGGVRYVAEPNKTEKKAADLAAEAAKLGVEGVGEALTGLAKLFGVRAGGIRSFPGVRIDPETYAQAKPHFQAALKAFQDAGKSIKDLFKFLIQNFGEGIKPYALHFAREQGLGTDLAATPTTAQTAKQESANVSDRQESARDDRAGNEDAGAADARQPDGERRPASGDRAPREGSEGVVPGSAVDAVQGGRAGDTTSRSDGAAADADGAAEGGSGDGARTGDRVPERKRDGRNYVAPAGSLTREGSWRATAARNLDIVELVKRLEAEKRQATPDEQAKLVKFTGWGASEIAQNLFPQYDTWAKPEWKELVERRSKLMTPEERNAAARSSQYAHYTSEDVIRGIWDAVRGMGFNGGTILEPGMGVGLFATAAPSDVMAKSRYTGIEFDPFTAAIGKQLLQRENIIEGDYSKTKLPKDFFDLAIGNPPFGKIAILNDPEYAKQRFPLHDYFFAKTMDRVRPGGLVVFVTSRYTMDKQGARARKYLADRADLLGAIRLPQTAFKGNAGTEVVTDILFLRKRNEGEVVGGQAWEGLKEADGLPGTMVNEYFVDHPDMVLGKPALTGTMYSNKEYTVQPREDETIEAALKEAIAKLPQGVFTPRTDSQSIVRKTIERDFSPKSKKEGTLYVSDKGDLMRVESGSGVGLDSQIDKPLGAKEAAFLKDYVPLRDAVKQAQYDQLTDGEWEKSLKALNKLYDGFVKKHGNIRAFTKVERQTVDKDTGEAENSSFYRWKNAKTLFLDVESPIVEMLETITEDDKIEKSPFLLGRTIKKPARPEINSTRDALLVSLDERGGLDLDYIATLAGKDRQSVIDELGDLVYEAPDGQWKMADEYLSGDVVTKLEEAEAAAEVDPRFERNVKALIRAQPKPLAPKDITVQMGAGWIPTEVYEAFADEILNASISITHVPQSNTWKIEGGGGRSARNMVNDYGTPDRSAIEIFETALMGRDLKITRKDADGKQYTDKDATAAVNEKLKAMKAEFSRWMWTDAQRGERMAALYNRSFNNLAPRTFDGSHLTLPGLSLRYKLYDHQKRAIWRVIQTGNTYLAHAVGAGKTLEMIVSGMEMRRLGLVSKPMYAVPKHMLKQFASEFLDAYPTANILVADDENFDKANRGRFVAQAALNNPDAIIITHPAFSRLSVKDESRQRVAARFIGDLEMAIEEEKDKFRRKEMEAQLERLERRFESKAGGKKDEVVDFEDLGVDFVFVDEAHYFRKLDFVSRRGNIKGIDASGSARALDLFIKLQHLESKRPGRAGVLASGTPIVNTMAELFSVMRMMSMTQIEKDGLDHFDVWANQFGDVRRELEQNAAGAYEFVERFAQFVNVPELMSRVRSFMDVLTSSQLGDLVERPDLEGNQPDLIINPVSDRLDNYLKNTLAQRIETSRKWKPSPGQPGNPDPLINIITDGRLAAIDMRFVDPEVLSDPDSKLNRMLEEIVAKHKAISDRTYTDKVTGNPDLVRGGTQIVFSAVGFGDQVAKSRGFDVRAVIVKTLTEGGIKRDQIAFMSDYGTDAKKAQLFKDMRAGKVRVLFGSPQNMGTGVNVQKRLSYLHFLSPPWYPADVEQPHGRIIRQGNQNTVVGIKWYATKGTYDSTMWQMVSRKAKFIESAFTGDASVRKLEDVSESSQYEMASALSSGDQRAIQLAGLNSDIERLSRLRNAHEEEQNTFRARKSSIGYSIKSVRERIERYEKTSKELGDYIAEPSLAVGGKTLTGRIEIGEAVRDRIAKMLSDWKIKGDTMTEVMESAPSVVVGKVMGKYDLVADGYPVKDSGGDVIKTADLTLILPNDIEQQIEEHQRNPENLDPGGLYTRIRNKLNSVATDLAESRAKERQYLAEVAQLETRIGALFQFEQDLFDKTAEAANLKKELAATSAPVSPASDTAGGDAVDFKLEPDGAVGMRRAETQAAVDALTKNWANAPSITVLDSMTDPRAPASARASYEKLVAGGAKGVPKGFIMPNGKIYVLAGQHIDAASIARTVLHEAKGHFGLRGVFGSELVSVLDQIVAMRRADVEKKAKAYGLGTSKEHLRRAAEEVLAEMAETNPQMGFVRRAVAAIRAFLRKLGVPLKLTDADIVAQFLLPASRYVEKGGQRAAQVQAEPVAAKLDDADFRLEDALPEVQQRIGDLFETRKTFGWWHNTIGTQYHKAQVDRDFKRVFDRGQQYLHDVSRLALGAADLAPDILPKLEKLSDTLKSGASPRELKPVADAIFTGTLEDEKVYSDAELRDRFKLNPKQVRLYRQARAAIDRSLEDIGITDMVRLARSDISEAQAKEASRAPNMRAALASLSAALQGKDRLIADLEQKVVRVAMLKKQGYAPLMRFGRYTVSQTSPTGEQLYFGMFEDEADARKMERELIEAGGGTVERGVMSQEAFKLFRGISPDTLEIFAAAAGLDDKAAFQEYLKLAVNNRSALKRLIKRKGIAGYNPDLKRVLAQFITSNARSGSGNLHRGEMLRAASEIPREKGDVKDEAVKLLGFVQDPQEEASGLRSFLFFNFLGGSVASAAVNMTQPLTMTLPYLSQWGAARAAKEVKSAFSAGLHRPIKEPALRAAMDRAIKDGVVEPHQIFELQGAAMQSETDWGKADKLREAARKAAFAWGRLFSMAEAFNRRLTFAAAFQIGRTLDAAALKKAGVADAYEFAVKAVEETQGIYNRGNRPDWARGAVGATIFTFKQFSIAYLEFLKRLPRRERMMALGVLMLAAGVSGLPGVDDLDDLIDTLAQQLGYSWNTKQERDELIERVIAPVLGAGGAEFVRNGVSAFLPIDVQARMGLQNLIPGTGVALKSKQDKGREVAEAVGPAAGLVQGYFEGAGRVLGGDVRGAVASAAPVAVQNAIKALDMAELGFYRDSGGRRVVDTTAADAAWKAIGFQPHQVAQSSRRRQTLEQNRALNSVTETEIADLWAQGIFEKDASKVARAKQSLSDWNRRNPESRIRIVPNQILRRVKEMGMTADQRYLKRTPPELRPQVQAALTRS